VTPTPAGGGAPSAALLPVFVLTGPTGAGKSEWAERLAQESPVEIVSVDSALVYRGLDIGSAKPDRPLRQRIPHHLIDICEPADNYSAGRFVADAIAAIRQIHARGRVPLLVGGTMLYLRALLHGLAPLPQASPQVRREIDARAAREGWSALHAELAQVDPAAAARIQPHDAQRIQRAIEVFQLTGRPLSELQRTAAPNPRLRFVAFAWSPRDRSVLYQNIAVRFQKMLELGFLEEVRGLYARGDLSPELPAVRSVGYRQFWAHCAGECTFEHSVRAGILATRHLARRQLIWLRADASLEWIDALDSGAYAHIERRMQQITAEKAPY